MNALQKRLLVLHAGRLRGMFFASFEVSGVTRPPDVTITRLARALLTLPPATKTLWKQARDRVFDIGLESARGRRPFTLGLRPETIKTISRLNARVALTLYAHGPRRRRM